MFIVDLDAGAQDLLDSHVLSEKCRKTVRQYKSSRPLGTVSGESPVMLALCMDKTFWCDAYELYRVRNDGRYRAKSILIIDRSAQGKMHPSGTVQLGFGVGR